tara:strand:- start:32794 stop:33696 length:903 start_codon:yes stop_codon:yes gene_type:complete
MEKEVLVNKWLNNELNREELEAFKKLDAYSSFMKLSENAKHFKAPDFDSEASYKDLKSKFPFKRNRSGLRPAVKYAISIAAIFILGIGLYFTFFNSSVTTIETGIAQNQTITLPDNSTVVLNAKSILSYNNKKWDATRKVTLEGEAYFKVANGKTFEVETTKGKVTVLGTAFNVKSREDIFEISCYEGLVNVSHNATSINLPASNTYRIYNGAISFEEMTFTNPSWLNKKATFKSVKFAHVLNELERHYDIKVISEKINTNIIFTGSFALNDLDTALQSITLPLQLGYTKEDNKVILFKK